MSWGLLLFEDAASSLMFELFDFHDYILVILTLIVTFAGYALVSLILTSYRCNNILKTQEVETIWTVLPAVILIFLAFPSLRLLYLLDELEHPSLTIKTIGHQWYWSYEYSDFLDLDFDAYMLPTENLIDGQFRLLEVDSRAIIPWSAEIQILVTAADVMHAWTVPSFILGANTVPYVGHPALPICSDSLKTSPLRQVLNWIENYFSPLSEEKSGPVEHSSMLILLCPRRTQPDFSSHCECYKFYKFQYESARKN